MKNRISRDRALRAMTDDGAFRVITLRTTDTVRQTVAYPQAEGLAAQLLGELITGTVLVRQTMAPQYRVQAILSGPDNRARFVADSHPDGGARGLFNPPAGEQQLSLRDIDRLQMMRVLMDGRLHQGFVKVPEEGGVTQALMAYMTESEQIATMLSVACVIKDQEIKAAGGYLVQLLPEVTKQPLQRMTDHLQDFQHIDHILLQADADPSSLLNQLLNSIPYTELEACDVGFQCRCSDQRVLASLATLDRSEIRQLIDENRAVELNCEYCGKEYRVDPTKLQGLLSQS